MEGEKAMEEKVESMERSMEGFKELLDEAASIALLLEENLELAKEERNTLYAVKALHRILKGMQKVWDSLPKGGDETLE